MSDKVVCGDCLDVMKRLPDACVDAIVTDPPYGLSSGPTKYLGDEDVRVGGFMGKSWDHGVPGPAFWTEALRVAKPGAHLVAFGGTRTYHRLTCAIEDAGWEIRDCLSWLYGSGFPKSLDVSKAIDKAAGAEREAMGVRMYGDGHVQRSAESIGYGGCDPSVDRRLITAPATDAARQWQGWGTALKPAWEPIILARKPLVGTVAANVLAHGTGAINVDACRVGDEVLPEMRAGQARLGTFVRSKMITPERAGRWPANVALDEEAAAMLDEPARFFYTAKASRKERGEGNTHPTVKSLSLMRWLVRLVTPKGGNVLDPFAGSGTTLLAAHLEGFDYLGIEREAEYVEIIRRRLERVEDLR